MLNRDISLKILIVLSKSYVGGYMSFANLIKQNSELRFNYKVVRINLNDRLIHFANGETTPISHSCETRLSSQLDSRNFDYNIKSIDTANCETGNFLIPVHAYPVMDR